MDARAQKLTKEVRLMQELMELFVKYQLSSDLMSYDGPEEAPQSARSAREGGPGAARSAREGALYI